MGARRDLLVVMAKNANVIFGFSPFYRRDWIYSLCDCDKIKSWLLLLAFPVLLISFFIFYPGSAMIFGFIRSGLIGLTFAGLVGEFINGIGWLTVLSLSLIIIWYAQRTIYRKAVAGMINAALEHEDLLCFLWSVNALNIAMYNGDSYWAKWRTERGRTTYYDTGYTYEH